jgi:hypothetical protein
MLGRSPFENYNQSHESPNMTILLIGGSNDSQFSAVMQRLNTRGIEFSCLDHSQPTEFELSISETGEANLLMGESRSRIQPSSVWCRTKINTVFGNWDQETVSQFVSGTEWRALLQGIAHLFDSQCVQRRSAVWAAELKPRQLAIAGAVGLKVPSSSFFCGRRSAHRFCAATSNTVGKVIKAKNYPRPDGSGTYKRLLTFDVDAAAVSAAEDHEFLRAPLFFQERLKSGVEYRVIAIGQRAFSYRVLGAVEDRERPDDRMLFGHKYQSSEVPQSLQKALCSFLEAMNLDYGAFDLIQSDNGDWYFLECNPEGQWSAANGLNMDAVLDSFIDGVLLKRSHHSRAA